MQEEKELIQRAKKDIKEFESLYKTYHKRILLFCYQRVEDKSIAQDICSNTFLKAMKSINKFQDKGFSFGSWLYRIAYNLIQDYYKKNKRVIKVSEDFLFDLATESKEEPNELIPRLKKALLTLKPEVVRLIEMRFWEERPFKEIAEILEVTEVNAKTKTYRGLEKLKQILIKK